jgi:hypothetical protein
MNHRACSLRLMLRMGEEQYLFTFCLLRKAAYVSRPSPEEPDWGLRQTKLMTEEITRWTAESV